MSDLEAIVIGAGVVGLAIGRALASRFGSVAVVERNQDFGMETSSRNSEVIHAGIYYKSGSKKASMCRNGSAALYEYCLRYGIPHLRCGKLIVGKIEADLEKLQKIIANANENNIRSLRWLDSVEVAKMEPDISCDIALHSPDTGIIDSHALMSAYLHDIKDAGGFLVTRSEVIRIELGSKQHKVFVKGEDSPVSTRRIVNAAGLSAGRIARLIEGLDAEFKPEIRFARGVYFRPESPGIKFRHLIYPVPDDASLGIHATIDLAGSVRFGPDVEWIDNPYDYTADPKRASDFKKSISSYFPAVTGMALRPDYAGIRPKLVGPNAPAADFRIDGPTEHRVRGVVNLFGIESPGLTASLALADYVSGLLD